MRRNREKFLNNRELLVIIKHDYIFFVIVRHFINIYFFHTYYIYIHTLLSTF